MDYRVFYAKATSEQFFNSVFEAENYAELLSEAHPKASVYLEIKGKDGFYYPLAKYRDGMRVCRYSFDV